MIGIATPSWLEKGIIINKKELSIPVRFWFRFINSNLIPYQNKSIHHHPKAALVGSIMDYRKLNLRSIIAPEILTKGKHHQTSLQFLSLNTTLWWRARVPIIHKTDVKIVPPAFIDIRCIEVEYQYDEDDRARKKPMDIMPIVDIETLESSSA